MSDIDGLLIDIDGVLVVSWEPIPGSADALAELRDADVPLRFATNTTSRSRAEISAALTDAGMPVDVEEIVTAAGATASYLRDHHPGARCLVINEGDISEDLVGVDVVDSGSADVVVLGGAGPSFGYEAMGAAFSVLADGAPLVAMHRNLLWQTRDGLALDTGFFVTALEQAAGVDAVVIGKPAAAFFEAAASDLGLAAERMAMVGDDVHSDVIGAQQVGMTGILVRTGKFRPEVLDDLDEQPDLVLDTFADVPRALSFGS